MKFSDISMIRGLVKKSAGLVALGVVSKLTFTLINDDIDDLMYDGEKTFKSLLAFKDKASQTKIDKPKIIVLGTGWAAMSFLKSLDTDKVDLRIISPRSHFFYTPLLAGTCTGTVTFGSITEPIRHLEMGSKFIQGECISVDPDQKTVLCETIAGKNISIEYDQLVIAVGAKSATYNTPGVTEHAIFMKEIQDSMQLQKAILQNLEKASSLYYSNGLAQDIDNLLKWVIIGGGPTGVELTAELTDFVKVEVKKYFPHLVDRVQLTLVEATNRVLGVFDKKSSQFAKKVLEERGATVLLNTFVTKVTNNNISIKSKDQNTGEIIASEIPYGSVVWCAGIAPRSITESIAKTIGTDIQSHRFGLLVDEKFRVKGVKDNSIWALGDCAVSGCGPTAQAANQQGSYLGRMFRDTNLMNNSINSYPNFIYKHKGALAYVGGSQGVAELKNLLWDSYPMKNFNNVDVEGRSAFAIWRSLYFSKLLSGKNQAQVLFDWMKTSIFGREISTAEIVKTDEKHK